MQVDKWYRCAASNSNHQNQVQLLFCILIILHWLWIIFVTQLYTVYPKKYANFVLCCGSLTIGYQHNKKQNTHVHNLWDILYMILLVMKLFVMIYEDSSFGLYNPAWYVHINETWHREYHTFCTKYPKKIFSFNKMHLKISSKFHPFCCSPQSFNLSYMTWNWSTNVTYYTQMFMQNHTYKLSII